MAIKVFYSWQSKRPTKYNMWFILKCLEKAVSELRKERDDITSDLMVTRDTQGIPGSPNIILTIGKQISESDIIVCDLTYVSYVNTSTPNGKRTFFDFLFRRNRWQLEGQSSVNVVAEMSTAKGQRDVSYQRVIAVMNTEFGVPGQFPFDLVQTRKPFEYRYSANTKKSEAAEIKKQLTNNLKSAIRETLDSEHERQKEHFAPFVVWKYWEQTMDLKLPLETTDYVLTFFDTLRQLIADERRIVRICGLSGIGKTRLVYECFNTLSKPSGDIQGKVLYVDENLTDAKQFLTAIRDLKLAKERKILIVDNCSVEIHNKICSIVATGDSRLNLISISGDPDERPNQYDANSRTDQIVLKSEEYKSLVDQLLRKTFPEFTDEDRQLLVDFSSGLPFIAKLMTDNPERGRYEPGTLTQEEVVRRLLGPLYENDQSKSVMYACCLFSQLGFKDDLAGQLEAIALNEDLFGVSLHGENPADIPERRLNIFRDTCTQLKERQLLEIRGRAYAFRPSPLAVRLAEDWWRSCTMAKFTRIMPVLEEAKLVEKFCEQFRYLRHVQNARDIVAHLCNDFFSSAEVLNTEVGSRLFRSFVYVNPTACASALVKAFLHLSFEEIRELYTGRRNLVWSLEKLCFRRDTFQDAIAVITAFAAGENENLGNNATNQFLQLFHIFLPGTTVDLITRWNVIEHFYNHGFAEYQSLSISAMSSALVSDHFHRMGGAEDIGDASPEKDYEPSRREIYDYWQNVIQILYTHITNAGPFKDRAIGIIKDRFYALCSFGGGSLIVPIMRKLITEGFIEAMEARKLLQFVINSGRVYDERILTELKEIYETLKPGSFVDRFKIYVSAPSTWEYRSDDDSRNPKGPLMSNIDQLSKDFLAEKANWKSLAPLLFSGSISEGLNFGRAIFRNSDKQTLNEFLDMAIEQLSAMQGDGRNIGIILGVLSEKDARPEAERIFEVVLHSQDLKYLAFSIARTTDLPYRFFDQLLTGAERGEIPVAWFLEFNYGWGLRHLPVSEIIDLSRRLRKINSQGKFLAFYNLATWINGKEEALISPFAELFREMIMEDSKEFFANIRNSMDVHYYSYAIIYLLSRTDDRDLAKTGIDIVISESSEMEHYYAKEPDFFKILETLQQKYFPVLWEALSKMYLNIGDYGLAPFNMKSLLGSRHDYQGQFDGLLFVGDPKKFDIIFDWCRQHRGKDIFWIAELLPVFGGSRNSSSELHPYAKAFIDEFGDDKFILSAISAKIGTYGWVGSIIPKLVSDKAIFMQLIDHSRPEVREWAQLHLEDVDKRIQFEIDREAEGY